MELPDVLINRRSIRKFRNEAVDTESLQEVMEAARLAPSAKNLQPWKFIIIKHEKRRRLIAQACGGQEFIGDAPIIIVACAVGRGGFIGQYMESWPIDIALAMDHLMLAAWNKGLGTCWIGDFDEEKVKELCSIPPEVRVAGITPLGYPAKMPQPSSRQPLEKILCEESYSG